MTTPSGPGLTDWIHRGTWSRVTGWFRVPRTPPELPFREGQEPDRFRPAPGFLGYARLRFWLILVVVDTVLFLAWLAVTIALPVAGAVLALPAFVLIVVPDIIGYVAIHLRYDATWYVVGERSLRIRRGLFVVTETTITFENVQNVKIKQGPLERHFGIANLIVETAGGGAEGEEGSEGGAHRGLIEGVDNARELRDRILACAQVEAGAARERAAHRWPENHLRGLTAARDALRGRAEPRASALPADLGDADDGRRTDGPVGRLLKLPSRPPELPAWAGDPRRFRPARSYLGYELLRSALITLVGTLGTLVLAVTVVVQKDWADLTAARVAQVAGPVGALILFLVAVSLFTAWYQYRVTWYVVGDRGLRLRRGVWIVRETTITFDNVQNVGVRQGPIERLFGIWSVRLHTAGSGGASGGGESGGLGQLVTVLGMILSAVFPPLGQVMIGGGPGKKKRGGGGTSLPGLRAPEPIRDHVMERVRASRAAGLGDDPGTGDGRLDPSPAQLAALAEVREEIRLLARAP